MLWLIGLIILQQASFHWFLEPFILFGTPLLELSGATKWIFFLGLGGWLLSGRTD